MEAINQSQYPEHELEELFQKTFDVYRNGSEEICRLKFKKLVETGVDPNLIFQKYKAHYDFCLPFQNGNYTPKDYRIKKLSDFLEARMYNQEFGSVGRHNKARDNYLYGI